jgi:hypothetical protein
LREGKQSGGEGVENWNQVKLPALSVIIGVCLIGVGYLIVAGLGIKR